ncbi:MAG: hypothetical protein F4117_00490 [Acidimicrobiales bacterium]|nr:hypothetical protein [Acidimicrobiaceae bacterium]MXV88410.1 hypothetical protein [Acidimicrobiales bacterium]MXX43365.1 hypothetical protein [Acidimicrobiales bacterium]MYB82295.1 hypothetical protein [Acidimicrobiales bacterium]MYD34957.1 hypothetical protein [Acidimicrobiales bacterium]
MKRRREQGRLPLELVVLMLILLPMSCSESSKLTNGGDVRSLASAVPSTADAYSPVPILIAMASSGRRCEARLLEAAWSYPTKYIRPLEPPEAQSFPTCALAEAPEVASANGLDELELRFDGGDTLPDVIDISWFTRVPESEADVFHVTQCAVAVNECRIATDRNAVVVKPPTEAAKAGVWALWFTPEGVEIGPDDHDAFNTAFWGVSLR